MRTRATQRDATHRRTRTRTKHPRREVRVLVADTGELGGELPRALARLLDLARDGVQLVEQRHRAAFREHRHGAIGVVGVAASSRSGHRATWRRWGTRHSAARAGPAGAELTEFAVLVLEDARKLVAHRVHLQPQLAHDAVAGVELALQRRSLRCGDPLARARLLRVAERSAQAHPELVALGLRVLRHVLGRRQRLPERRSLCDCVSAALDRRSRRTVNERTLLALELADALAQRVHQSVALAHAGS